MYNTARPNIRAIEDCKEARRHININHKEGQIRVSPTDLVSNFLTSKLLVGPGITITTISNGGNEQVQISLSSNNPNNRFELDFVNQTQLIVIHNLNKFPSVTILDILGNEVEADIKHLSQVQLQVDFGETFSGKIICN